MSESFQFLEFSLLVILAYYALRSAGWRRAVLLLANFCFLATFFQGVEAYLPFALFLILSYAGLRLIHWKPQQLFLPVLVVTILAFIWLKKYAFVPSSLFLHTVYVTVGLSYILFRVLHLMIDTRSGKLPQAIGFVSFFNYTANFLTLVSGPIQLYQAYQATEDPAARTPLRAEDVAGALERITRGIFKTNVLALLLTTLQSRMVDSVTASHPEDLKLVPAVLMFVLFPFFLYCNFSGYIDIVIGIGRLLGVTLPENFARPFASDSAVEFWGSRWHITLSSWLKTYVYNPLLMTLMRRFPSPALASTWAVLSIFVTFFLIGAWHGQTSEFIFFGFLFGLGVSVSTVYQIVMVKKIGRKRYNRLIKNPYYVAVARGLTFTSIAFTLVWFWSNWSQIRTIQTALGPRLLLAVWLAILAGSTILLAAWEWVYNRIITAPWNGVPVLSQSLRTAWSTMMIVVVLAMTLLLNQPAPDIVYKAF